MKQLSQLLLLVALLTGLQSPADSGFVHNTGEYAIEASFGTQFGITIFLHKNTSTGTVVPAMNFGQLVEFTNPSTGAVTLRSSQSGSTGTGSIVAMIYPQSSGTKQYFVNVIGTPLTNATGDVLPTGACTVALAYSPNDQWDGGAGQIPQVGTFGAFGSWVVASPGRLLYTSNSVGAYRAFQAHFAITDDPATGATMNIPVTQKGGTYNGTVIFTMTE